MDRGAVGQRARGHPAHAQPCQLGQRKTWDGKHIDGPRDCRGELPQHCRLGSPGTKMPSAPASTYWAARSRVAGTVASWPSQYVSIRALTNMSAERALMARTFAAWSLGSISRLGGAVLDVDPVDRKRSDIVCDLVRIVGVTVFDVHADVAVEGSQRGGQLDVGVLGGAPAVWRAQARRHAEAGCTDRGEAAFQQRQRRRHVPCVG